MTHTILAIDDEAHNLALVDAFLDGCDYSLTSFDGGEAALAYLAAGGAGDAILLDRMMPGMDGMAFMAALRRLPDHKMTPVIMQSGSAEPAAIAEGLTAGAYYYITKPYSRDVLRAIIARALTDGALRAGLQRSASETDAALRRAEVLGFAFRTLDAVKSIAFLLASLYPDPPTALLGITELMMNAIEHGNLGLTYEEKSAHLTAGTWQAEIERRLATPEGTARMAHVRFERNAADVTLTIEDAGAGFDWNTFLTFDRGRARHGHGRGIAMSRAVSFDDVTYYPPGNRVVCRKRI